MALDEAHQKIDLMDAELARDVESARLFRLLTKLSTVVDRAELNGDESWSEYGDRYMLKLFRDYVFHQVRFIRKINVSRISCYVLVLLLYNHYKYLKLLSEMFGLGLRQVFLCLGDGRWSPVA